MFRGLQPFWEGRALRFFGSRRMAAFFFFLIAFLILWCGLRLPWLSCDGGIPSMWEYGYHVTDEGYYLEGGKEKYLWGAFVDLTRMESFTYGYAPGMHWIGWLASAVFGLSTWTWRIPFFLINLAAWSALFCFLSKRTRPLDSFLLCAAISCTPMLVMYERTASTDVLITSLLVLAYVVATGKHLRNLIVAAFFVSAIALIKPSVYVLLPFVLAGVLSQRKLKNRWWDAGVFIGFCGCFLVAFRGLQMLLVYPEAHAAGLSAMEIIRRTTSHYPLPSILDFQPLLRGLSCFPRDPSEVMLGYLAVLIVVCPVAVFLRRLFSKHFFSQLDYRLLLYLLFPAYVAAISIMNTLYTHYFIPVLMMFPVLWLEMRHDLRRMENGPVRPKMPEVQLLGLALAAAVIGVSVFAALNGIQKNPQLVQSFYSRIYNLPQQNVWLFDWPYVVAFSFGLWTLGMLARGRRWSWNACCGLGLSAILGGSVCWSQLPAVCLAPYIRLPADHFLCTMSIGLAVGAFVLLGFFVLPRTVSASKRWSFIPLGCALLCFGCSPRWQISVGELLRPGTHYHRDAAAELSKILPANAVVTGERADQMLLSLPIRPASTGAFNSDPIPVVKAVYAKAPETPIFAIIDTQHTYNLQHYQENASWCTLVPIRQFKLPSFATGQPVEVYLCSVRITAKPPVPPDSVFGPRR